MVALLAGCGGGMSPAQLGTTGQSTVAQLRFMGATGAAHPSQFAGANAGRSWMAPDAKKSKSLLYVADQGANDVEVYSYPDGKLKGTLTGFQTPSGVCSNKAGDVFILNGNGTTVEVYKHGGTSPIRTLDLPGAPELNCSVDPVTGNLALGVLGTCGNCFVVFPNGSGTPTIYTPSGQNGLPGCGYDNHGNLFCDAYGTSGFALFELSKELDGRDDYGERRERPNGGVDAMGRHGLGVWSRRRANALSDKTLTLRIDGKRRRFDVTERRRCGLAILDHKQSR
jgi:hypothetical protein